MSNTPIIDDILARATVDFWSQEARAELRSASDSARIAFAGLPVEKAAIFGLLAELIGKGVVVNDLEAIRNKPILTSIWLVCQEAIVGLLLQDSKIANESSERIDTWMRRDT